MKRLRLLSVVVFVVLLASFVFGDTPKYIFLFIGDGMGPNQRALAEKVSEQAGLGKLEMNNFPVQGKAYTASANSIVTDSAASATAIACGVKTNNGMLGMLPNKTSVNSVAVDAKKAGWKVGILTSVPLNHATPSGFYAHVPARDMYDDIAKQMAASGVDFFGGAGIIWKGNDDIYELLRKQGYATAVGLAALNALSTTPAVAVEHVGDAQMSQRYQNNDAAYKSKPGVMTLADLTAKAIKLLDNPKGFFIMVEGGAIDWAGHGNDFPNNAWETIAMNDAVRVALEFAKTHPNETLIITTADHETGGLTITGPNDPKKLLAIKTNGEIDGVVNGAQKNAGDIFERLDKMLGLKDISETDRQKILEYMKANKMTGPDSVMSVVVGLLYSRAGISWTTGGHTAKPATTTATGPGSEAFKGKYQNTHIADAIRSIINKPAEKK